MEQMTNLNINDYLNEINQTTKTIDKASHKPTPLIEKKAKTPTIKPFSLDLLDSLAMKADTIRNYSVKWLIKDFILPQSLGMIYASAGSGKSFLTLFLTIKLLKDNLIKKAYYLDADNSIITLKIRKIDKAIELNPNLKYLDSNTLDELGKIGFIDKLITTLSSQPKNALNNTLIIFDSIRNFHHKLNKDDDVIPLMDNLQRLRDYGANVIFLHHQPKQSRDKGENDRLYKGATAFEDSCDYTYFLQKQDSESDNEMIITLEAMKKRNNEQNKAYKLDLITFDIEEIDYFRATATDTQL